VEVVAIGAALPFLTLLATPQAAERLPWLIRGFEALGAVSPGQQLVVAAAILASAAIAAAALKILLNWYTQSFVYGVGHDLLAEVIRRALLQPYEWHSQHNSSEHLATLAKVELVTHGVFLQLARAIVAMVFITVIAALLLQVAPVPVLAAALTVGGAYLAVGAYTRRRLEQNSQEIESALEQRIRTLRESFGGIRDLILDGTHDVALERFRAVDRSIADARANSGFLVGLPRPIIDAAGVIIVAAVALLLAARTGGFLAALPMLGVLALAAQRLLPLTQQLYQASSSISSNKAILDDLADRLKLHVPERVPRKRRSLPFTRSVEFRGVGYAYPKRSRPAVCGLDFVIPRGSRVAILGRTGAGKSTTADLLMGLLAPQSGEILIDGVALTESNRAAWRENIAHVPQQLFLSDAPVAQIISSTENFDAERLRKAIADSQLEDFVATLPDGQWTKVGEGGARLSGGQRQRLAIARAMYKQAPVLVLDEATSALDDQTEAKLVAAMDALQAKGCTVIVIAHRGSAIARCNLLIRLEGGRVAEHAALEPDQAQQSG